MITYAQASGELSIDGHYEGSCYSGTGKGRNNPAMEDVQSVGPIPRGKYSVGHVRDGGALGPLVFDLLPVGHTAHGRTLFRIHGDNKTHDASHGCIIAGRAVRQYIADSAQTALLVT